MGSRRSLRFLLFVFDALRLVAVVSVLSALRALFSGPGGASFGVPAVAFAAPQALFPLMALFSWIDPARYAPYPPLYAAGKTISATALAAWLIDSADDALLALGLGNTGVILLVAVAALVLLYDLVAAGLAVYLVRHDAETAASASAPASEPAPTEQRAAAPIETVSEAIPPAGAGPVDTRGGA
jgi:hypothetical protein